MTPEQERAERVLFSDLRPLSDLELQAYMSGWTPEYAKFVRDVGSEDDA